MSAELVIDGAAFAANLAVIRAEVAPAHHMLVVKDDAYGHGLVETVTRAWRAGIRHFGAFDVSTGRTVRETLGEDARVFVWIVGSAAQASEAVAAGLMIGVGDALLLEDVAAAARIHSRTAEIHLKADTGLHRNGVRPEEWDDFVRRAAELEAAGLVRTVGVWSHIAEASDAEDDAARAVFDTAVDSARRAGLTPATRHLAASAAAFARPEFRYDMVRIGAFAYGIRPAGGPSSTDLGIRPIAALQATTLSVDGEIATVGVGALDGLPSTLAGKVRVGTPDGPRPLMALDERTALVEAWPDARPGDVVTVFGPGTLGESSATALAEAIDTIGEEIAVRVSPVIPRRWI